MIEQPPKEEILYIIKHVEDNPTVTQRILSNKLRISLGKTNYLLKELIKKGFIKAQNFSHSSGKLQKIHYILTKQGIEEKMRLIYYFLETKEAEYNLVKKEWEHLMNNKGNQS